MRVIAETPAIHARQALWKLRCCAESKVFYVLKRNLKTSRHFRLLCWLFGQRSDNNFGHNPCDVDFGQIPGDDNFGCIPAAATFWCLSRSRRERERGSVTVPQSIHSHTLKSQVQSRQIQSQPLDSIPQCPVQRGRTFPQVSRWDLDLNQSDLSVCNCTV